MSFSILPLDILRIIVKKCDILSLLRLEKVCKRLRNIINNDEFWKGKFKRTDGFWLVKTSPDNKIRMIIREIINKRTKLVKKYEESLTDSESIAKRDWFKNKKGRWTGDRSIVDIERDQYKYLCNKYPKDDIVTEIKVLYKNLQLRRKLYPLEKRKCISCYGIVVGDAKEKYENVAPNTIVILYSFVGEVFPRYLLVKGDEKLKEKSWSNIPETKITNYLLDFKDTFCLSKEEFIKLYDFPFKLGEEFDYL